MPVTFSVTTSGIREAIKMVHAVAPKQLRFTLAVAITETARDVEFIVKREIQRSVDRPRAFTINSVYSTRASKQKLEAVVTWRDFAGKGTPGSRYLRPIAEGGSRELKRNEVALRRLGLLPAGYVLVPGQDAPLDAYGNVPASLYVQMLSALRAFSEVGYLANRVAKLKRKQTPWFVIRPGDKTTLAPGIYQRLKTKRKLIFAMVRAPQYRVQFPFDAITTKAAAERLPIQFNRAFEKAMATAHSKGPISVG